MQTKSSGLFKNVINKMGLQMIYIQYIFTNPSAQAGYDIRSIFLSGV